MRVLQVAGTFPPGRCGVGDYVHALSQGLSRIPGVEVGVLTRAQGAGPVLGDVELLTPARDWRMDERAEVVRQMRSWRADIVHLHYPANDFEAKLLPTLLPLAARRLGARVIQTWHEHWPLHASRRFLIQRLAMDGLIVVRPDFLERMPRLLRPFMPRCPQRLIGSAGSLPVSGISGPERLRLRERYGAGARRLVVFFGFIYPEKGVERLFSIADPSTDALVVVGGVLDAAYRHQLELEAARRGWSNNVQYAGYLEPAQAADLIAAADAVVLPFLRGAGDWNTSVHSALDQGTLVITTSTQPRGDDVERNLYTAPLDDTGGMAQALRTLAGRRRPASREDRWQAMAQEHLSFYETLMPGRGRAGAGT